MGQAYRRRLRNCIRPDTYRYYLDDHLAEDQWNKIMQAFGNVIFMDGFNMFILDTNRFVLRKSANQNSFTLIKKKHFKKKMK